MTNLNDIKWLATTIQAENVALRKRIEDLDKATKVATDMAMSLFVIVLILIYILYKQQ